MEIVEILLSAGADPSIKNDLGQNVASLCSPFPELCGMLKKRERRMKLNGTIKIKPATETLGKRISTATPIRHDMWLISLETVLMLYGSEGKGNVMEVHQNLKDMGFLVNWTDVPSAAEIIFVSHEWLSWAHPDPGGEQLKVLCRVLERLKKGRLDTEMDPMHTIMYKHKFTTKGKDWTAMLKRTYLWVDWFSMPQPGAEKEDEIGKKRMANLRERGSMAIRSIPAYVERSDFIMILVPGCHHSNRNVPTCYRTWRRRGWCLLELYAAVMARDSSNPPLLVRSERGTPMWMSPMEVMKLSIGMADFTCCQRNHVITTETQKIVSGGKVKKIPCDKPIAGGILEQLINAKIIHQFTAENDLVMARLHYVFKHWWMRELIEKKPFVADKSKSAVEKFKKKLRWIDDEKWFDRGGVGVLAYAVVSDEPHVVRELLQELKQKFKGDEYTRRLKSRIRDEGYVTLGIPGGTTTLMAAMMTASPEIVSILLEAGANVNSLDAMGNDAFMYASTYGRPMNLQCWFERVKGYDLEGRNAVLGATPLTVASNMGADKFATVSVLLKQGARVDAMTHAGFSVLMAACANEDSGPKVVKEILKLYDDAKDRNFNINYRMRSQTTKWKLLRGTAKLMVRTGLSNSNLMSRLAHGAGMTALHYAARRGDVEIVKLLLEAGADPNVENDLGVNAFEICDKFGPFPTVMKALQKNSE